MKFFHPKRWRRRICDYFHDKFWYYIVPDVLYMKIEYRRAHNCSLNLKRPQTIDEKLQWIKLYDRKPIYHTMIDKIASKHYVEGILGTKKYTIPLLGCWDTFEEIDFNSLPNQFVLKCNHDSGSWVIVRDKERLDKDKAREKLTSALRINYYHTKDKQWGYDSIKPKIMAEYYLAKEKLEYQVFCNNGQPVFILVRSDLGDSKNGFNVCYDTDWKKVDYRIDKFPEVEIERPVNFAEMVEIAIALSKDTLHLRVDFYEIKGRLYIGELTFYSNGGNFHNFTEEGRRKLSETLQLPVGS